MKQVQLIREIREAAKAKGLEMVFVRQGGNHEIWRVGIVQTAIPRHGEIGPKLEFEIRAQLEPALGKRWWR